MQEPLSPDQATATIKRIVREGAIEWTEHAVRELAADDLTTVDAVNVMRAGAVSDPAEYEHGAWRYRIHTARIWVVIEFNGDMELTVITAWRRRR
jgi:hypothetical protein